MKRLKITDANRSSVINGLSEWLTMAKLDEPLEIVIRKYRGKSTLEQLGGLFGCWLKEVSERTGDTVEDLHKQWKARWLARIYCNGPRGPLQEMWVERLYDIQMMINNYGAMLKNGDELLQKHMDRLSLSWADAEQMSEYMHNIEAQYQSDGVPLQILDKFRRSYERY